VDIIAASYEVASSVKQSALQLSKNQRLVAKFPLIARFPGHFTETAKT
jgi:hypothetical protein